MNTKKKCAKCQLQKETNEYGKDKQTSDGLRRYCLSCARIVGMKSYFNGIEDKRHRLNEAVKLRYRTNPIYKEKHKLRMRVKRTDPIFRLNSNFASAMSRALKGLKGFRPWEKLAGYSIDDLKRHLEARFLPGMTWENYGQWHVDHIKPISRFEIKSTESQEFFECWSLDNLTPLWEADNIRKSNKI